MDDRTLLIFWVAQDGRLALPLEDIQRVVPLPLLQVPVATPKFVEGFFDFHGTPVAALRLDRLLSLGESELGIYSPLLVLKGQDPPIALHVGGVDRIIKTTADNVQTLGKEESFNACVVARITDQGDTVYLLSAEGILLADERAKIAAHQTMRQKRIKTLNEDAANAS